MGVASASMAPCGDAVVATSLHESDELVAHSVALAHPSALLAGLLPLPVPVPATASDLKVGWNLEE